MQLIILAVVFVAITAVIVGTYLFLNRRQLSRLDEARARLNVADGQAAAAAGASRSILKDTSVSSMPFLENFLAERPTTDQLSIELMRAGLDMKPGAFVLLCAICAAVGVVIATFLVFGWFAVIGAPIGALGPWVWMKMRQKKRLKKFEEQLPESIDMLVSAMKAGYSFQAAMRFIGEEVAQPLGHEFTRFYEEQRLGMEVRTALLAMQERVGSLDLKMFVTAVLIQRETGGNLSEVLGNISFVMRERAAIRGEVETLTAESKLSARILTALPITLFFALWFMDPQYMGIMFRETSGIIMIVTGLVMITSGYSIMMKIANVDI
jgi:tight adherence protein B